jgi:uncharacterized lipoprotein YddW (UPF0748 family)
MAAGRSPAADPPEYRAQWLDAFHTGYLTADDVTTSVQNLRDGRCNVLIPEILVNKGSQLVYYNAAPDFYPSLGGTIVSNNLRIACDLSSEPETNSGGDFDPLAECIAQAHDTSGGRQRLDVWAWLVSFRAAGPILWNHPDWVTVNANGSAQTDFDPGHPGVEQQLVNTCRDLVTNTAIDGLNFDYIRFTDGRNGFNDVSVRRFNALTGATGVPATTDDAFKQWRRDQVTNVMRKIYLTCIAIRPGIRITADTITWTPSPPHPGPDDTDPRATWKTNFEYNSGAYTGVYQDWRGWMQEGIVDIAIPMNYFRSCRNDADFENWQDFTKDNTFARQCIIGPGTYLNTLADAISQLKRSRAPSSSMGMTAQGYNLYSYASPYADTCGGSIVPDPAGMANAMANGIPEDAAPLNPDVAPIPALPRLTNGKGHLMGTAWDSGAPSPGWLDGATVSLAGPVRRTAKTDGTGFYGFVDLPPGDYSMSVSAPGLATRMGPVTISPGAVTTQDVPMAASALGPWRAYALTDVSKALAISSGLRAAASPDMYLNVASPAGGQVDMADALTLMRKVSGVEANP